MRASMETIGASKWLQARRQLQQLADVVLGDAAEFFLYRGKLYSEGAPGQYISALLGSTEGCETVLRLIERLGADEAVEVVIVDEGGCEPDGRGLPVLRLVVGHLSHCWLHGRIEPV
jgi:hypothetical protein